jgi:photosystem II stability/assembly factor-like uncharacterized protein
LIILARTRSVTNSTAVFSGMVAPGRYRLAHASGSEGSTIYTFPLHDKLGQFEVKTGEVSLLGTLLVQLLEDRRFVVGYVPPGPEMSASVDELFPALAEQTRGKPVNTFDPSPELTRQILISPRIRQVVTATYNNPNAGPGGTMFVGSKMGRIIWRKAGDSRWRILQIDTWKEVLSVCNYRGGLLAAGEEGLLRHSTDEGKTWAPLTPPAHGLIAAVTALANGKVIAVVRRDKVWTAYASDDVTAGVWRKIGTFEEERSLNRPGRKSIPLASSDRAGVMMPNGVFYMVNGSSETIERSSTGFSTLDAYVAADGILVAHGAIGASTMLVSSDGGKTWTDLKTNGSVRAITFANPRTAYAIAAVAPFTIPGTFALMVSRDGAQTWTRSGDIPGGDPFAARRLLYDRSDGSLLALMENGQVLRSTDEGKTWTRSL